MLEPQTEIEESGGDATASGEKVRPTRRPREPSAKHRDATKAPETPSKDPASTRHDPNHEEDTLSPRSRTSSAPAKRVVSDGHWRRKRSPPKSTSSSKATRDTPSKAIREEDVCVTPIRTSERRRHHKRKSEEPVGAGLTSDPDSGVRIDDGIRVYSGPPSSCEKAAKSRGNRTSSSRRKSSGVKTHGKLRTRTPSPQEGRAAEERLQQRDADYDPKMDLEDPMDDSISQRSPRVRSSADDETRPYARGTSIEERSSARSRRSNLLSHAFGGSKKLFVKPPVVPVTTPRIPSIEAWLDETPDPFVNTDGVKMESEPMRRPSPPPADEISKNLPVKDPNAIWEVLDTKEGTRRHMTGSKKKRRVASSSIYEDNPFPNDFQPGPALQSAPSQVSPTPGSILNDAPDLSPAPASLRRRGAKRNSPSPTRERSKSLHELRDGNVHDVSEEDGPRLSVEGSSEAGDLPAPLRPPGLKSRRPFPTTGAHRLSTIASVSTLNSKASQSTAPSVTAASDVTLQAEPNPASQFVPEERDAFDPASLQRTRSRIAKHSDLMSVLSLPRADNKSIRSARSIRTNRSRLATATISDLMKEFATDEEKYMRELRTLVDGVIPVLLTCVLSRSDSAAAAGLFSPLCTGVDEVAVTKPIIDMGVALERLKALHRRVPKDDVRGLMTWAHGAQRVYSDYIKVWRMGFQDVVVNLAPAADDASSQAAPEKASGLDDGLPRNGDGDVVNAEGERVDVAYLLKRPLVRLKYVQKTLKGVNFINPSSEADMLATKFQELVNHARNRSNEERGRLEDEAASNIDPTRARDLRTMAPLAGVTIDRVRHVKARDNFNLSLQHTNGQRIDCRAELILRDDPPGSDAKGDILICEVEDKGRWLLYPPIQSTKISARNGDKMGEIVVMVTGFSAGGAAWQELLTLQAEEEQVGFDWVQMLGLDPVPPKITRSQSFVSRRERRKSHLEPATPSLATLSVTGASTSPVEPAVKSRTPSPREVDIPIGEKAHTDSKQWVEKTPLPSVVSGMEESREPDRPTETQPKTPTRASTNYVDHVNDLRTLPSSKSPRPLDNPESTKSSRTLADILGFHGTSTMTNGLRRTKAKRASKSEETSPQSPRSPSTLREEVSPLGQRAPEKAQPSMPSGHAPSIEPQPFSSNSSDQQEPRSEILKSDEMTPTRPPHHRSHSSVPSIDPPSIPKLRRESPSATPVEEPEAELDWPEAERYEERKKTSSRLTKRRPVSLDSPTVKDVPPPPPAHRSASSVELKDLKTPNLSPTKQRHRRSSSPLKHEYEPSTASESSSDSDTSTVEHNVSGSVSDLSSDEEFDPVQIPAPLMPVGSKVPFKKRTPPGSLYSGPQATLAPSNSASQAPYKTVPAQPTKANKTIASIFAWSDKGVWENLHPDECSITITPGLIEAHEMSSAHSKLKPPAALTPIVDDDAFSQLSSNLTSISDKSQPERPLVALELTPHVALRHGTAIDICVRSPPTPASRLTVGTNNIMFRSRNPEECEALYALINHARIHNPTYIALMNARPRDPLSTGSRPNTATGSSRSSWFGGWGRSNSYRASSNARPVSVAQSDSSIGSMASTFSALKRFKPTNGGGLFSISRSTVTSRIGSGANSIYSSSDSMNSSGHGSGTASPAGAYKPPGVASDGIGLSGMKIRFYERETASKWREMGSARLTIMRPPLLPSAGNNATLGSSSSESMASAGTRPSSAHGTSARPAVPPSGSHMDTKRIVVQGKTKGETLLDVTLGENCFERVARTGIAVYVWEDVVGPNGELGVVNAVGGVVAGRARVYMIQVSLFFFPLVSFFFPNGKGNT